VSTTAPRQAIAHYLTCLTPLPCPSGRAGRRARGDLRAHPRAAPPPGRRGGQLLRTGAAAETSRLLTRLLRGRSCPHDGVGVGGGQGFDFEGKESFWTVAGDTVRALAFVDYNVADDR
jgi:hypothetical protein